MTFFSKHVVLLKSRGGESGGLEKYASRIALAFAQKGARVSLLTTGSIPPPSEHTQISFFACKTSPWPSFLRMEQYDRFVQTWLAHHKADIVFGMDRNRTQTHIRAGNGVHASFLESRILTEGKLKHLKCLLNPLHRKILKLEKEAFENPELQKLFTNSFMVRKEILKRFQTDPAKIKVIHNGVEWGEMQQDFSQWQEKRLELCTKWQLDPHQFHFLFIGNGYLRKGLDRLLEALAKLPCRDFHLSVIGKDNRIELYRAKALRLGLKEKVRFFGPQSDIRSFYQLADVLTIPSFYDPFANVTVEALAMGLFVVSSQYNGGTEVLDVNNGVVIEDLLDDSSLIHALERSLCHRKSSLSAQKTREGVKYLDFSNQLQTLIHACE